MPAYEGIVKPIVFFITNKRVSAERAFEEAITKKPIFAKHNPWHGASIE